LLEEAISDNGKVTKVSANARLKKARYEKAEQEEIQALQHVIDLFNAKSIAEVQANEAKGTLDTATLAQYGKLTEDDVKSLVVDDKWAAIIQGRIINEVNALTLTLVARIEQLGDRYAATLDALDSELRILEAKTAAHLAEMGVK
jgi:type I restriction enzyme M protein